MLDDDELGWASQLAVIFDVPLRLLVDVPMTTEQLEANMMRRRAEFYRRTRGENHVYWFVGALGLAAVTSGAVARFVELVLS